MSLVGTIGKVLVVPPDAPAGIINPRLIRFSFDERIIHSSFFTAVFETKEFQSLLMRRAQGGTMGVLNAGILRPIHIPVPPVAEQRAIAAVLGDVDTLLTALDALTSKKRNIKHAVTQQLLTGRQRLPGFSAPWQTLEFAELADNSIPWSITGGPFGSSLKTSDYVDEGVRIIQLQNIGDGVFHDDYAIFTTPQKADELISCNIYPGDIILSKMGDPVARACLVPPGADRYLMASDGIRLAVDPTRFDSRFVHGFLNSSSFRRKATEAAIGSTRQRIGLKDLKRLPVLAPTLDEQRAIAAVLSDMDAEIAALEAQRDKTRAIKQGMMQELLTGRIRLV